MNREKAVVSKGRASAPPGRDGRAGEEALEGGGDR